MPSTRIAVKPVKRKLGRVAMTSRFRFPNGCFLNGAAGECDTGRMFNLGLRL